ncbi:MAG TPA: S-adenosylmethionine:tRNA ribosyltransferase-isomerase [Candidatus Acidoferrales bacterium]|nr:S-adenosylmethionine:tRNA ribosyltransferase-isomerase [Candidatus Acidoferrales bacterium]
MSALPLERAQLRDATAPPERRGLARDGVALLFTQRATGAHRHAKFTDLPSLLDDGDLAIVNDSATIPAAIEAVRPNGESVRLHVATAIDERLWMVEPRGEILLGEELQLAGGAGAVAIAPADPQRPRLWYAWFQLPVPMYAYLARFGKPIAYAHAPQPFPLSDYQTMFAREAGSSEMPSAARPFTPRVVRALRRRGVGIAAITLHCGVSSFELPERPATERFTVGPVAAAAVNRARREGRRVIAVGSTVVRALESAARDGAVVAASGWTSLVVDERHPPVVSGGLITGFHDAGATHQSMLRAFLPAQVLASAYVEAAERGYLRHEFGDVHLIA